MIIDSHTHIYRLPNSPFEKAEFSLIFKSFLKELKSNKVSAAFLLPAPKNFDKSQTSLDETINLAAPAKNIHVLGTLDPLNYKKQDIEELDELLKKRKIKGIKLYPGYQHFYPDDKICKPIYDLCIKHNVPVIFHSGDTLSYESYAKIKYSQPILIDEVATNFPDLKIIIAHLGNPWMTDCAEVLYKNKNVYADLSGLVVQEGLNTPYGKLMKKKIQELAIYSSPQKLLYGTDWPLTSMRDYIKFVKNLGFSKKDLDFVFYKNAKKLFKI